MGDPIQGSWGANERGSRGWEVCGRARMVLSALPCRGVERLSAEDAPQVSMRFTEFLSSNRVLLPLECTDKWEAISHLMEHLTAVGAIESSSAKELHDAVLARERSMSTGMEKGIAIPHAAVDALDNLVAALGIVKREPGLAFDSLDSAPTQFVVLLLIPRSQKLLHIRTLAEIARMLGEKEVRDGLLASETPAEALVCLEEAEARLAD